MKRYYINWYNGGKMVIDLVFIPLLIIWIPLIWAIICEWWLVFSDNLAIPTLACAILAVAVIAITLYFGLANRFFTTKKRGNYSQADPSETAPHTDPRYCSGLAQNQ